MSARDSPRTWPKAEIEELVRLGDSGENWTDIANVSAAIEICSGGMPLTLESVLVQLLRLFG